MLSWPRDSQTELTAINNPIRLCATKPLLQFGEDGKGCGFNPASWNHRVIQPAAWPEPVECTPQQIMNQFQHGRYTQALAMIACWGLMWRQPKSIWGLRDIEAIERTLANCADSITETRSVEKSCKMLTGNDRDGLGWTSVIASKTLHFLCRSLGFEQNAPAAIDGRVIRGNLWPSFRNSIPVLNRPKDWNGHSFEAYSRYMTAILLWAEKREWSTKEMEATIFAEYK
jgi:hypothetical protein